MFDAFVVAKPSRTSAILATFEITPRRRPSVGPGQPNGVDFCRGRVARVRWPIFGCDENSPELGDHVGGGRLGLGRAPGRAGAVVGDVGGWCPAVAYQTVAMLWQARMNGMARCTTAGSLLRASPAPKICLASSIATSMHVRRRRRTSLARRARPAAMPRVSRGHQPAHSRARRGSCSSNAAATPTAADRAATADGNVDVGLRARLRREKLLAIQPLNSGFSGDAWSPQVGLALEGLRRRARAHQVAVPVGLVDPADRRPVLRPPVRA